MRTVRSASSCDLILRLPTTFTLGFSKTWGARSLGPGNYVILGEHAFGTPGFGGSLGFADGEAKLSFGYVMNRMGGGVGLNERGQGLVDAAYRAVGYRTSEPGFGFDDPAAGPSQPPRGPGGGRRAGRPGSSRAYARGGDRQPGLRGGPGGTRTPTLALGKLCSILLSYRATLVKSTT